MGLAQNDRMPSTGLTQGQGGATLMKQILYVGLLAWSTAQAVELGSISLTSASGEPFRAQIPVTLSSNESLENLSAAILETKPSIPDMHLVLDGPRIKLSTKNPVALEKVAITLQVSQVQEDSEYHYEVTLASGGKSSQKITPFVYGPVKSGDTLWQVASKFARHYHLSVDQARAALYKHNEKAFAKGDQNQLLAGSYLKLPAAISKKSIPSHKPVYFKPTEVVTQARELAPPPEEPIVVAQETSEIPSVIPTFPQLSSGQQVAMNVSSVLPGVPALKLLNPLSDVDTSLFSSALNTVLSTEDTVVVKLLDKLQEELKGAHEAIKQERQSKLTLQNQVNDLQVQLRALTELVALKEGHMNIAAMQEGFTASNDSQHATSFSFGAGNEQWAFLAAAVGMAALLMYAWDYMKRPKPVLAKLSHTPKNLVPQKPRFPSLAEVDQCMIEGRYYQAQDMLSNILSKQPSDFDALYKLCQVYTKTDNRMAYETKLKHINSRWREMYPERFERLENLYHRAWASTMASHDTDVPVYEGDPPSDPVQTKLDLARAYIDIGDQASARDILLEVLKEGTSSQILSAEVLMSQLQQA